MDKIYYTPTEIFINYIMSGDEVTIKKSFLKPSKTITKNSEFDAIVDTAIENLIKYDGSKSKELNYLKFACTLGTDLVQICQNQITELDLEVSLMGFYLYKAINIINFPVAITYYLNEKVDLTKHKCFRDLIKYNFDLGQINYGLEKEQPCVSNNLLNWETMLYLDDENRPKNKFISLDEYIKELALDLDERFEKFLDEFDLNEHERNFYFDLIQYELDLINLRLIAEIDLGLTERKYCDEDITTVDKLLTQARLEVESNFKTSTKSNLILKK